MAMRVSTKGDYGIRALIELAHHYGERPVQSAEIAARQRVPEAYLEQLLIVLRKAGFLRSVRGPQGGHALIRDPYEIKLSQALSALEGDLSPIDCLDDASVCSKAGGCAQRSVWEEVREAVFNILDGVTIGELAERERTAATTGARYYI
jgi:Rrf2 family protein